MENLIRALEISWKGMLTIFVGITAIYLAIFILSNLDNIKKYFIKNEE